MNDCAEYRTKLEDIIGAYFEHGDGPGLRAVVQDANRLLIDNAVSHRHEGWEGPSEACPVCRAHTEADELRRHANERRDMIECTDDWVLSPNMTLRNMHMLAQEGCRFFYLRPKDFEA